MNEPLELLSSRLRLRRLQPDDAAALCAYRTLPEVARFQSWTSFTLDDAARLIDDQNRTILNTPGTWLQLALTTQEAGVLIGDCGLHFLADDNQQAELGITLSPNYQGRGLASEALRAVLRYLFETLGKHRVWATTDADNVAATSLFRRLGFRQEAHFVDSVWFKGAWGSEFVFALLQEEWRAA